MLPSSSRRLLLPGGVLVALAFGLGVMVGATFVRAPALAAPPPVVAHAAPEPWADDLCRTPGVRLATAGAETFFVAAAGPHDLAGRKARRDRRVAPWLTVEGKDAYVHAVAGFASALEDETTLSLFTLRKSGVSYELARGGPSTFRVSRTPSGALAGRFELDVERSPGAGAEHVRGTFCLPAAPFDPNDVAP